MTFRSKASVGKRETDRKKKIKEEIRKAKSGGRELRSYEGGKSKWTKVNNSVISTSCDY